MLIRNNRRHAILTRKWHHPSRPKKVNGPIEANKLKLKTKLADLLVDLASIGETMKRIGCGAFGSTFEQEVDELPQNPGTVCAIKVISNERAYCNLVKNFMTEIEIQSSLDHIAILPLLGFSLPTKNGDDYKLLTPFMQNGSLDSLLQNVLRGNAPDNWDTIYSIIIFGIAAGMAFANQNKIIHRNLKPSHIILDDDYQPKIGNFAMADYCEKEVLEEETIGTPLYMAPETFENSRYTKKCDVYAYSLNLYEILTGHKPFYEIKGLSSIKLYTMVINGEMPAIQKNEIPSPFEELITRCWNSDPEVRPSFAQIVKIFVDHKSEFFDFSVVDEFNQYVAEATKDLDLSID